MKIIASFKNTAADVAKKYNYKYNFNFGGNSSIEKISEAKKIINEFFNSIKVKPISVEANKSEYKVRGPGARPGEVANAINITVIADVNIATPENEKILRKVLTSLGYKRTEVYLLKPDKIKVTGSLQTEARGYGMKQKFYTKILEDKLNVNPRFISGPIKESLTIKDADPKIKAVYDTAVDIIKTESDSTAKIDEAALFIAVNDVLDRKYGKYIEWE